MARPLPGTTVATAAVASANVTANADRIRISEPARTCLSPMSGLGGRRDVLARWSDPRSPADFERQMTTCMAAATMSHEQSRRPELALVATRFRAPWPIGQRIELRDGFVCR